ncbi:unnamed protein product [Moneuplotes crassus]|uniref:Transmembrane protein 231 n=1 Tax=Euplotes crassus TaxID=5936 RepID=A0AAD2D2D5_EUPCR|nr:unnamed protein product [Moneuplotes crassus]
MVNVYIAHYPIHFKNRNCSAATLLCLVITVLLALLPLILAIATNNFIIREKVAYEQPDVKFTNEFIAEALIGTTVKQYSTVENINKEYSSLIQNPQLTVTPFDRNDDLKAETLTLEFEFFHLSTEQVKGLNLLFYLQYTLGGEINTQFKTLVYKSLTAPLDGGIQYAQMRGDLDLKQKNPVAEGTIKRELYNTTLEDDFNDYGIRGILDLYVSRNQTTEYTAEPIITSMPANAKTTSTKVKMIIDVPLIQPVWHYTSVIQVLKLAWIEFFALFIPIYFILYVWLYGFFVKSNVA